MPNDIAAPASAVVPPTPEATKEVTTPDTERYAQLARREQALRKETKRLQAEKSTYESQWKAKEEAIRKDYESRYVSRDRIIADPMSALNEAGITPERLANYDPKEIQIQRLEARLAEYESKVNSTLSKVEDGQKAAYDQAVKQLTREVSMLVDGNETYETIKATSSQEAVVALIEATYKDDGILLSAEEAAQKVEDYLLEEAVSLSKLKKVQSKLNPEPAAPVEKQPPQQKPHTINTLTHRTASQANASSSKDRVARAIAAFNGQLK